MEIELFSDIYEVHILGGEHVDEAYELCSKNIVYYEYCPPFVTRQSILDELEVLPPGKMPDDKYYIGFYEKGRLIAVMDMIDGYPEKGIAYIGFFMTAMDVQGRGVGTGIIEYLCKYLTGAGYEAVRLAWVKGNPQAEHFWLKNHFTPIRETKSNVAHEVIEAQRSLTQ